MKKTDLVEAEPFHQDLARLFPIGNLHLVEHASARPSFVFLELNTVLAQETSADQFLFYLIVETGFPTV